MPAAVVVLRVVSLLALVAPLLLTASRQRPTTRTRSGGGDRAPLVANLAAFAVYVPALVVGASDIAGAAALLLAVVGSLIAMAGGVVLLRSRTALGSSWSLLPRADQATGLVTTGPYRLVRHPIYLAFAMLATGEALAFASGPALVAVLCGIVPTFAWRARAEESLLSRTFGERYAAYRRRTRMLIPYLL